MPIRKQRKKNRKNKEIPSDEFVRGDILCQSEFVIFEFQLVAYVNTKGEKSDGNFGYNTGVLITDVGIVSTNVNDCAEHIYSS